jgi:hypothetical protein
MKAVLIVASGLALVWPAAAAAQGTFGGPPAHRPGTLFGQAPPPKSAWDAPRAPAAPTPPKAPKSPSATTPTEDGPFKPFKGTHVDSSRGGLDPYPRAAKPKGYVSPY